MFGKVSVTILVFVTSFLLSFGAIFFMKTTTYAESTPETGGLDYIERQEDGRHVVVLLQAMRVELRNGTTTIDSFPIISKGKPGSYYETIGGRHLSTYKVPLHFSSIGHVYMPSSVHVFGNYFIHGIPYYPTGEKVSSAYSGGCIRLSDEDAEKVFAFVEKGTPIIISQVASTEFSPTETETTLTSSEATRLMVAIVSLEALSQDNDIVGTRGEVTTRKKMLPSLLRDGDMRVATSYASTLGQTTFTDLMNKKARALGLSNTFFPSATEDAITSQKDIARLSNYINNYKSYVREVEKATSLPY